MIELVLGTILLAPAAPVPVAPPPKTAQKAPFDDATLTQFANLVENLANQICDNYVREPLDRKKLLVAAVQGLYEETGQAVPESVKKAIEAANTQLDRIQVLREVRTLLGSHPSLAGSRALFAAMNGYRHATDPQCVLTAARINASASIEQDFGIGIELEGVTGMRWAIYQYENRVANGMAQLTGYFGPRPRPDEVPSPAEYPWRVRRVIPGSPAQKAGIRPGDVITHLGGTEITADNVNALFAAFAMPRQRFDPQTGRPINPDQTLTCRRGNDKPFAATLKGEPYTPESAFGVWRTADGGWDCMLDREHKIGYIRLGPIESEVDSRIEAMLDDLARKRCRAVILDLRWCPGGYVTPGTRIAGLFLPSGSVVAKLVYTHTRTGPGGDVPAPPGGGRFADLPLVVLVGHDTIGGGELIASALRDNDRCVVVGQRTYGRATIQQVLETGLPSIQFRVTTGTSLRPNGKNRQRTPESQPTDDWGIRPDEGLEVPVTAAKAADLRRQADLHSLRPADSREALPFDDPANDPFRLAALKYLKKKLGPPK